ncbi:hypothetical protein [Hyunsoonleella ulvae]|uniref:hypothetical protein n=1 Tax=Hyunsoonleella ulvae TaxID=2799948 RepID=UPI00193A3132|nr:hypothetical protein [Hyunsoonleella ulvae]
MKLKLIIIKTAIIVITVLLISYMSPKIITGNTTFSEASMTHNKPEDYNNLLSKDKAEIICSDTNCEGQYHGPEFIDGSDIAHQFSNKMSNAVGDKLKELYKKGDYSKVDFPNITMSTEGMSSGIVTYKLSIPFITVEEKCDAYTSFDHVGGWNHKPAMSRRKAELNKALMKGHALNISDLKVTPEGLQEYWIQWKNKIVQFDCK